LFACHVGLVLADHSPADQVPQQHHRFIKKITRPMQTFRSFSSAVATLVGIEVAHMIRKGQFDMPEQSGFGQFALLSG